MGNRILRPPPSTGKSSYTHSININRNVLNPMVIWELVRDRTNKRAKGNNMPNLTIGKIICKSMRYHVDSLKHYPVKADGCVVFSTFQFSGRAWLVATKCFPKSLNEKGVYSRDRYLISRINISFWEGNWNLSPTGGVMAALVYALEPSVTYQDRTRPRKEN